MNGPGRRGRRGGRRQRRREEQARQHAAQPNGGAPHASNGQSGPGHPALVEPEVAPSVTAPAVESVTVPPVEEVTVAPAAPAVDEAHPRPMSARELVARLEAMRAHEEAAALADASAAAEEPLPEPEIVVAHVRAESRNFAARGEEWIATVSGRGSGGTGRVAPARIETIRFAIASDPERIAAEIIVPRADLDILYDEELAELLERGLRSTKGNA